MSRLIDELRRVSQGTAQPMGFAPTSARSSKPKMLLIASLVPASFYRAADSVAGADAGLLAVSDINSGTKAIEEVLKTVSSIPWGVRLKEDSGKEIDRIVNAGCDFVIFTAASTALAVLQDDGAGKILEVTTSLADGLLRAIDKLPIDAVLINSEQDEGNFLTWHHLMHFQHCADLLTKPLLASVPSNVVASELQALWAAGISGVLVEVAVGQPKDRLMELHKVIDELTLPTRRRQKKPTALVPQVGDRTNMVNGEPEQE